MSLKIAQNQAITPDKRGFSIVNKGGSAAIYLYDFIGEGGITDAMVVEALAEVKGVDLLSAYINSPGGDVFMGTAIYNNLARFGGRVDVQIDGRAASIASLIACAGDHIGIAANGVVLIHDPSAFLVGSSADLRRCADLMDQARESILDAYVARTGGDRAKISKMMAVETQMNAQQAVDLGFADAITQELKMVASFDRPAPTRLPDAPTLAILPKKRPALVENHESDWRDELAGHEKTRDELRKEYGHPSPR